MIGAYPSLGSSRNKSRNREADIAHLSGQVESREGQITVGRPQQPELIRPGMRGPSPSIRQAQESKIPSVGTASRFGFGKSDTKSAAAGPVPELRGKSSRNVLRRKPSSVSQHSGGFRSTVERSGSSSPTKWSPTSAEQRPSIEASLKSAEAYSEIFTSTSAKSPAVRDPPRVIPELDRYRTRLEQNAGQGKRFPTGVPKLATQDLPPPTPLSSGTPGISETSGGPGTSWTPTYPATNNNPNRYSGYSGSGYSASPSTRFSESPGPGAYSRDTTPTSVSSQSPGIIAPSKNVTPRLLQGSPAFVRPPVTRRRAPSTPNDNEDSILDAHGLPSLQESLTSSSSNSTVKGDGKSKTPEMTMEKKQKKKKGLSPLPPSPPPRISSKKSKESPPSKTSPSKSSKTPAKSITSPAEASSPKPRNMSSHRRNTSSTSSTGSISYVPIRPSREGTPNIQSQLGGSIPVIQSNLTGLSNTQDKQGRRQSIASLNRLASPPHNQPPSRVQGGSRLPSRNPSPAPLQHAAQGDTTVPSGLGIVPDLRPAQLHPSATYPATRTPSPSIANSKSKFGLFSRRTKTAPAEIPTISSKDRVHRKGPAAGTGHEGYGKYGNRGRSGSASGLSIDRNRSTSVASSSQESVASTRTHDPFFLERMSPVIIAGGGEVLENKNASSELTRTESNTTLLLGRPSMESKGSSNLSHEVSRITLWPSPLPKEPNKRASAIPSKSRRPSDSSDDGIRNQSLVYRRSTQRLNDSNSALHLPRPVNISNVGASPSLRSLESSIMSDESQFEMKIDGDTGRKRSTSKLRKQEKRPKSPRKWNLFRRPQPKKEPESKQALPVTIGRAPVKTVPHYAMMDSSDEQQDADVVDFEDILRDADVVGLTDEELDALQFSNYKENLRRIEELKVKMDAQKSLSLPDRSPMIFSSPEPPQSTPELLQTQLHTNEETAPPTTPVLETELHINKETAPARPSRLPQVGRIPKVVSARPETTSPKSFSRPFARLSTLQPVSEPITVDKDSVALGASPPKPSTPEPGISKVQPEQDLKGLGIQQGYADPALGDTGHGDFLAFSPRKTSEATTSSSGTIGFAGTTAVIPKPDAALEEDEVWDEYDDLIGNTDGVKIRVSSGSLHRPFEYEKYESRMMKHSNMEPKESPTLQQSSTVKGPSTEENDSRMPTEDAIRSSQFTSSSVYSTDMPTRVKETLATVPSPTTPMSFTDFFSAYGDRNNSVHGDVAKKARPSSQSSLRQSSGSGNTGSGAILVAATERNGSPLSQVNLRVGSMTVSKWLTFGHVLFSPAREEITDLEGSSKSHSILVIDGLGNGVFPSSVPHNPSF